MGTEASGARRPEDWPVLFTQRLKAGDVEGLIALYADEARFLAPTGGTLAGREQIRAVLAGLVNEKRQWECQVVQAVVVDDVALLYTNFKDAGGGESGSRPMSIDQRAIEVLRRQSDGSWKLIVGDPLGRER
ncbi:MAG: nuclear transport factor 2 family protein [Steroidobacteraceae bacterium]